MNHQDTKAPREPISAEVDQIAKMIVDSAFSVHSTLGPGLLESVYETCMVHEIRKRGLKLERQIELPVHYDGLVMESGFRLDLIVEGCVIVELKAIDKTLPVHRAQLLTYLKLTGHRLGFLINFNVSLIRDGIERIAL